MAARTVLRPGKKELIIYDAPSGKRPYDKWFDELADHKLQAIVLNRLDRLELYGHAGDYEWIGDGVYELKIHYGPGYRIYFGEKGESLIILLCGGDKGSQVRDIQKAQEYWMEYKTRP